MNAKTVIAGSRRRAPPFSLNRRSRLGRGVCQKRRPQQARRSLSEKRMVPRFVLPTQIIIDASKLSEVSADDFRSDATAIKRKYLRKSR